jgi:hypothetical protein
MVGDVAQVDDDCLSLIDDLTDVEEVAALA